MFELMGLIGLIFVVGLVFLAASIVLLPFYIVFRLLGFAIKVGFAAVFMVFAGILLLPMLLLVGVPFVLTLMLLALPLMLAMTMFSWMLGFFRRAEPTHIVVQAVPPTSS